VARLTLKPTTERVDLVALSKYGINEIASVTPIPNGIPKADGAGQLDPNWFPSSGSGVKTGIIPAGAFSGVPARATITFAIPYLNPSDYIVLLDAVTVAGVDVEFNPQPENKLNTGFTINLGTGRLSNLVEVGWATIST
jgi:hypothetical protein